MEYVKNGQEVICDDCGEQIPTGYRYSIVGEPELPVCIQCCYDGGLSISEPDEFCPECDEVAWGEVDGCYVPCESCGVEMDLRDRLSPEELERKGIQVD